MWKGAMQAPPPRLSVQIFARGSDSERTQSSSARVQNRHHSRPRASAVRCEQGIDGSHELSTQNTSSGAPRNIVASGCVRQCRTKFGRWNSLPTPRRASERLPTVQVNLDQSPAVIGAFHRLCA